MNMNPLILTNIQNSPYFKVNLFEIKTYHEVVDQIYYKVTHLEPWEKGSRKTSGQTGMCGGVRGVGAGGIVSSAYCLLYKLYTLKLTRKQVNGLLVHCDSPYIRGLGFMYIRYTQTPADLMGWFEEYLNDEEEIDPKAGGGKPMTIGEMVKSMLVKLEWFDTRFPRIPVNVQKQINAALEQRHNQGNARNIDTYNRPTPNTRNKSPTNPLSRNSSDTMESHDHERKRYSRDQHRSHPKDRHRSDSRDQRSRSGERKSKSRDEKSRERRSKSRDRRHHDRPRDRNKRDRERGHKSHRRSRSRSRENNRSYRRHGDNTHNDYSEELRKYSEHRKKSHKKRRSRSRSRERR